MWKYRVHQCTLVLYSTLSPEAIANLPKEQVETLDVYVHAAKHAMKTGDTWARIWASEAAEASQQAAKPVEGKLKGRMAALKRQVRQRSMQYNRGRKLRSQ
jgi:hypothetical protein